MSEKRPAFVTGIWFGLSLVEFLRENGIHNWLRNGEKVEFSSTMPNWLCFALTVDQFLSGGTEVVRVTISRPEQPDEICEEPLDSRPHADIADALLEKIRRVIRLSGRRVQV